ncbi:tRNA (adenine(22)-N(1))-methyltransferase [Anaerococcus degeneri]|uniref:Class I SAM-dependent methyltransferase n=1 Tax=Anaerococcus degeneri TaxID=361500 RepID=A0ABS7Z338_9FIRM|nr:class I SAM-dependent methyltransferase [Anaerococcus degeneri]MBP2014883.1 tRNA (adenine22-N1)-methyltransferase [Anaerococcus degeneri]MCA2097092.1 class I SAM-dependent methyltransferase [Anaerococcus degeneri]
MEDKKRLLDIINILDSNKKIIDVGTDHGLVPLYLAKNKISTDITATDISAPSLQKLVDRLDDDLRKIIKTRVTDGFKGLEREDDQVAIIAGMGANTIIEIIEESLDFAKNLDYMVLASNINTYELRHFLNDHGFYIEKDFLSYENRKYYDILKVYYGKKQNLSFEEYYYGKTDIENKTSLLKEKLAIDKGKNQGFLKEIKEKSQDERAIKKITDRLKAIEKVEERCKFEN